MTALSSKRKFTVAKMPQVSINIGKLASASWFEFRAKRLKQKPEKTRPKILGRKFIEKRRYASRERHEKRDSESAMRVLARMMETENEEGKDWVDRKFTRTRGAMHPCTGLCRDHFGSSHSLWLSNE